MRRAIQNREWQLVMLFVSVSAAILAIAIATTAYVTNLQQDTEIQQVSACQVHPAGVNCQKAKQESSEAASVYVTCIAFWKTGYPCPKPGSEAARRYLERHPDLQR